MSNKTWACFDCRVVMRRPFSQKETKCPQCGKLCLFIGHKIPIPSKHKVKEWELLRKQITQEKIESESARIKSEINHKHYLESEIERLKEKPPNEGRRKLIKLLEKDLNHVR